MCVCGGVNGSVFFLRLAACIGVFCGSGGVYGEFPVFSGVYGGC